MSAHHASQPAVWFLQPGLHQGRCTSFVVHTGQRLRLIRGSALVTLEGSCKESLLHAGQTFEAPRAGRLVIEAVGQESLLTYCLSRATMDAGGSLPPIAGWAHGLVNGFHASISKLQLGSTC